MINQLTNPAFSNSTRWQVFLHHDGYPKTTVASSIRDRGGCHNLVRWKASMPWTWSSGAFRETGRSSMWSTRGEVQSKLELLIGSGRTLHGLKGTQNALCSSLGGSIHVRGSGAWVHICKSCVLFQLSARLLEVQPGQLVEYGGSDWAFCLSQCLCPLLIHLKIIHCIQERDFTWIHKTSLPSVEIVYT